MRPYQKPNPKTLKKTKFLLGQLNCNTLRCPLKLQATATKAAELKLCFLAVQEHRIRGSDTIDMKDPVGNWSFSYSGFKGKSYGGVGLLFDRNHVSIIDMIEPINGRLQIFRLKINRLKVVLPVIYSPTNEAALSTRENFYRETNKAIEKVRQDNPSFKLIAPGDYNATIGRDYTNRGYECIGTNNDKYETNNNGQLLIELATKQKAKLANSFFRSKRIHFNTFSCALYKKRLDYFMVDNFIFKMIRNCRVFRLQNDRSADFCTDHRLLVLEIDLPSSKASKILDKSIKRKPKKPKAKPQFGLLRDDPQVRQLYSAEVANQLGDDLTCTDANECLEKVITALTASADKVLPKVEPEKRIEPWEDESYQKMISDQRILKGKERKRMSKKIKNLRKKLKKRYFSAKAAEINFLNETRNVEKLFSKAKDFPTVFKKSRASAIHPSKLEQHFKKHFSRKPFVMPPELTNPENYSYLEQYRSKIEIDESPPETAEIAKCLKTFKNGKCAGSDKINAEMLKYGQSEKLLEILKNLIHEVWDGRKQPEIWKFSTVSTIYKNKGSCQDAAMYRGISVSAVTSKIIPKIILSRTKEAYESIISPNQYGFRQERSTTDGIFILKSLLEKTRNPVVCTFIDLKAAYDWIDREALLKVFEYRTGATTFAKILAESFRETSAQITGSKNTFPTEAGLKQGALESPVLFNIYFDFCIQIAKNQITAAFPQRHYPTLKFRIPSICQLRDRASRSTSRGAANEGVEGTVGVDEEEYADDLVLVTLSIDEAKRSLEIYDENFRRFGLTVSFGKTETMLFGFSEEETAVESLFSISEEKIKNVRKFTYLGHKITNENVDQTDTSSLTHRIQLATSKFYEMKLVLQDREVDIETRAQIFLQAFVRSRLLYGCQSWDLREAEIKKLEVTWHGFLRRMINKGFRRKNDKKAADGNGLEIDMAYVYTNEDLVRITKTVPLRQFIYTQQLKYTAHLVRLPNSDMRKQILFADAAKNKSSIWKRFERILGIDESQIQKMMIDKSKMHELLAIVGDC